MRIIYFLIAVFLPGFISGQPLVNHCQEYHKQVHGTHQKPFLANDFEVTHYDLHIDQIDFTQQELSGRTGVRVKSLTAGLTDVNLDLLGFSLDSVVCSGYAVTHTYNDTTIRIQLSPAMAQGDSAVIMVYYHGTPAQDASGWGGFYFNGNQAFNLGVGFLADPHNFGRAWFPCIDNFVSRSTYDFYITTDSVSKAFCNGILQQVTLNPDGTLTWHWRMNQTIPTYLASMAVGPYATLQRNSNGIPVEWAALAMDTNNVLATFANLDTILYSFINAYGPYPFDKVGFCLVPFNSGAMEHASSIHIGRAFVNGSQSYSTLWAHELSHMWWGDKVTCETAEEMWLNEGFATYNEAYYTGIINGAAAYENWIRTNHRKVLQFAHTPAQDGSYLTMNAIPHANTYGFHVYQKGADIVHTLRNYMGDSAFFAGSQSYMNNKAFTHATSVNLRDEMTAGSGVNMNRFFDDWIFTPGFPHFSIDSVVHIPGGLDHMYVYTRQRSKGNNHLYKMPVEINFSDGITDTAVTVVIDSATNMFHIPLYFLPSWTTIDRNEKVSDAISSNEKTITATGVQAIAETNVTLNVQQTGLTPSIIRAEHNFIPPDPFVGSNPGIRLSDYHYWKVSGIFSQNFHSKASFVYDGSTNPSTGYLDNTFIPGNEDSLLILYRPGAGYNWLPVTSMVHNIGASSTDKRGSFTVDTLMAGEYTIGMYDYTVGIPGISQSNAAIMTISPNPSRGEFHIRFHTTSRVNRQLKVFDMGGRELFGTEIDKATREITWNTGSITNGTYHAVFYEGNKRLTSEKIILNR